MPKGVFPAYIVVAASGALIAAALAATARPSVSFSGPTTHGSYTLFLQAQCDGSCDKPGSSVVTQLTAGKNGLETGRCPYGAVPLPRARIRRGFFQSGAWFWLAPKTFAWFYVNGHILSARRVVGKVKAPAACGGTDTYRLRAGSA